MLQGRYNIITEGMKADDVATVQVLENHEHVKAMQDQSLPESAAINLKLKNKAKNVWTQSYGLSAGYDGDMLWKGEANLMSFVKRQQHVFYYGYDNTGEGADRSNQHYSKSRLGTIALTDIRYPGSSPVGTSLRNNEHAFYTSHLNKLSETSQISYSISYNHDIQRRSSYSQITYLLPGSDTRVVSEDISSRRTTNDVHAELSYENNADKSFLSNTLEMSGQWAMANGVVGDGSVEMNQHPFNRNLGVADNVKWIRRTDKGNGFGLESTNSVQTTPQCLSVLEGMDTRQDVRLTRLRSANEFSLLRDLRHHHWSIAPMAGLDIDYVGLNSMLRNKTEEKGNMDYLHIGGQLGAVARYVRNDLRLTFRLPLTLSYTDLKDEAKKTLVLVSPSFSLLWRASDNWTFSSNGDYKSYQTPWNQLITCYIMSD